jgi:hypothetical protein
LIASSQLRTSIIAERAALTNFGSEKRLFVLS